MDNIVSLHSRRAQTARGLTTTTSIVSGSKRASFVDRVLHAARTGKARFAVGDKVADKRDPSYTGIVHQVLHGDTVRYLVSFTGDRCICDQSALEKAGA